jgi:hypothetical protein
MIRAGNHCYNFSSIGAPMDPAFLRETVGASGSAPWRPGPAVPSPVARLSIAWRRVRTFLAVVHRKGGPGCGHVCRSSAGVSAGAMPGPMPNARASNHRSI